MTGSYIREHPVRYDVPSVRHEQFWARKPITVVRSVCSGIRLRRGNARKHGDGDGISRMMMMMMLMVVALVLVLVVRVVALTAMALRFER